MLEDHADAPAQLHQLRIVEGSDIHPIDFDAPGAGRLQPVDGAQQAGFAGPAAANDAEDAAGRDLQIDVLQGLHRTGR